MVLRSRPITHVQFNLGCGTQAEAKKKEKKSISCVFESLRYKRPEPALYGPYYFFERRQMANPTPYYYGPQTVTVVSDTESRDLL